MPTRRTIWQPSPKISRKVAKVKTREGIAAKEHKERKKEGRGKSRRAEIFALALFALFAAIPSSVLTFAHFASLREIFFGAISDL
jgi:hypothetical protein